MIFLNETQACEQAKSRRTKRAARDAQERAGSCEGHSCPLSRARLSRDFSRLPQMESLLTYRQANESLTRSLSIELDRLGHEM